MPSRILIALLCAGALAFACGPRSHSEAASTATLSSAAPVTLQGVASTTHSDGKLASVFDVKVEPGGVQFALRITNEARKHVEITFPNGQTHDFIVVDSAGREVWRWGATRMFTQSVKNKLLDGGETIRIAERWEKPEQHGKYVAIASLHSTNFPVEERVEFTLP